MQRLAQPSVPSSDLTFDPALWRRCRARDWTATMLYVVGGCSWSGTSMVAERMRVRHGIPQFTLDALTMGLHLGAPTLGVLPAADDLDTADLMWPVVEPILDHVIFDGRDYLVKGVDFCP